MRKLLLALAALPAASAVVVATATPSSAMASISVTASCGYGQTCSGYAQDVPQAGTGADVQVSCSAYTPTPFATISSAQATVVQCYIRGNNGDVHWTNAVLTQGDFSTLTDQFDAWDLTSRTYQVCVGAGYFDFGGNYHAPTNFACGATL